MGLKARKIDVMSKAIDYYKKKGQSYGMTIQDCVVHILEIYDIGYDLTTAQWEQLMVDTEQAYNEFIA